MQQVQNFLSRYWLAIASGVLVGTSFVPFPPWALIFCMAPLWVSVFAKVENWKQAFFAGWVFQFIFSLIGFYWVAFAAKEFAFLPWPMAVVMLLIFAAGVHLYYPITSALVFWLQKRLKLKTPASLLLGTVFLALFEALWPSLFPWNLGYPWLYSKLPLYHWADTIGFLGLSWMTHLWSAGFAYIWLQRRRLFDESQRKGLVACAFSAVVFAIVLIWTGHERGKHWDQTDQEIHVLQIQANIGNADKQFAKFGQEYQQKILSQYIVQTKEALQKFPTADVVVWPETAFPEALDHPVQHQPLQTQLRQFISESRIALITGAESFDTSGKEYNGLFIFGANGETIAAPYRKSHLLAFGERTPLVEFFPWLSKWSPAEEGFGQGDGPQVLSLQGQNLNAADSRLGVQICYEGLYPDFTRELSGQKAQWMVNITNDAWFGPTSEPTQHLVMTLARAIEVRRPLVRSTNTGISTAILANGEISPLSPVGEVWSGLQKVRFLKSPPTTFYAKYGGYWVPLLLTMVCLIFIFGRGRFDT